MCKGFAEVNGDETSSQEGTMTTAIAANAAPDQKSVPKDVKKDEKLEKRRALGRGLESLLPGPRAVPPVADSRSTIAEHISLSPTSLRAATPAMAPSYADPDNPSDTTLPGNAPASDQNVAAIAPLPSSGEVVAFLSIDLIDKNPYQTRQTFQEEQLAELRDSIKEHGVVQPVVVRPAPETGRFILVLGERRLRASKMAGKENIPALVRKLSPQQAAEMTVLENVVREDLNPIEQAEAYRVLSQEFRLTQAQIAERIGVSRESVANHMRLLRLPDEVKDYVAHGRISFSQAREMLALESREHILMVADELLRGAFRWDELKDRIARLNSALPSVPASAQPAAGAARWIDPNVRAAQMEIERLLGVRVKIKDRNGRGKIVIEYATVDDYERVLDMLRGPAN